MKQAGTHEGCIEQMGRLFGEKLFGGNCPVDSEGRIRMDDYEMEAAVQQKVMEIWNQVTTENLLELADVEGYWEDFYHMFGFQFENVDFIWNCGRDYGMASDQQYRTYDFVK